MWSTFSLSYATYFAEVVLYFGLYMLYVNTENSTKCCSNWHQTIKDSIRYFGLFEWHGPQKSTNRVWPRFLVWRGLGEFPENRP